MSDLSLKLPLRVEGVEHYEPRIVDADDEAVATLVVYPECGIFLDKDHATDLVMCANSYDGLTKERDELMEQVALLRSLLIDARAALRAINTTGAVQQIDTALATKKETS